MLIAYQAKIVGNQIHQIGTPPNVSDVDVLILPKPKQEQVIKKRTPPPQLKGKTIFDDDVWDTSETFEDWECFKEQ